MPLAAKPFAFDQGNGKDLLRLQLSIRPEIHHHFAEDYAETALFRRFEPNLATLFVDGGVNHRGGGPVARQFMKEKGRFQPGFRSGEVALDRKDIFAEPGQELALAARHGGILGKMRVTIDQPRKNDGRSAIEPSDRRGALAFSQIIVGPGLGDPAVRDDYRAVAVAAQGSVSRRVDQEPADADGIGVRLHGRCEFSKNSRD